MNSDRLAGFLTGILMLIKISERIGGGNLTPDDLFAGVLWGYLLFAILGPTCDLLSKNYIRTWFGQKSNRFYRYDQKGKYALCAIYHIVATVVVGTLIIIN